MTVTCDFDADELLALARVNMERGEIEEALAKLKGVVAGKEPVAEALALAARLYAQLGLMTKAQALFEKYVELRPGALHETFELGMTYFDAGKTDKAMGLWGKVLKAEPTHPPALFYSGLASARTGKIADAKRSLDILLKSAPPDNLYFSRSRELLREIDQGTSGQLGTAPVGGVAQSAPPYFSKTGH